MGDVETKNLLTRLHELSNDLEESLSLLSNAFLYHRDTFIDEADKLIQRVRASEKSLSETLIEASSRDDTAKEFCDIPSYLERIGGSLDSIALAIRNKIKENVLFSDKAVSEVNFLLNRTRDVLSNISDLILARNTFTAGYIRESETQIERIASDYATLHEERMIGGICMPKSSGIYITILDSIKRIAWNAKEISEKLVQ
jgi:Na+/phosphate symporter